MDESVGIERQDVVAAQARIAECVTALPEAISHDGFRESIRNCTASLVNETASEADQLALIMAGQVVDRRLQPKTLVRRRIRDYLGWIVGTTDSIPPVTAYRYITPAAAQWHLNRPIGRREYRRALGSLCVQWSGDGVGTAW